MEIEVVDNFKQVGNKGAKGGSKYDQKFNEYDQMLLE